MYTARQHVLELPPWGLDDTFQTVGLAPLLLHLWGDTFRQRFSTASQTGGVLDLDNVANLVASSKNTVQILLVVSRRDAETGAGADERSGGVANNDDRDLALEHLVTESGDLGGVVKHDGNDGRVIVAVDDVAETLQPKTKVARVEGNALETLLTLTRCKFTGDDTEGSQDLHENRGSRGFAEESGGVCASELVDDVLLGSNITTVGAEGLGQSTHEDINLGRIHTEVVANTAAAGAEGTDAVSLVDIQEELVLLLESQNTGEIHHGTLHRVQTLNSNENLLPGAVSAGLALRNSLAKLGLEIADVVVLERANNSARETGTNANRGVVELVREDQAALGHQSRERAGVGDETHGEDHGGRLANKLGHLALHLDGKIVGTRISTGAGRAKAILAHTFLHRVGAGAVGLGETEVVVGAHVEGLSVGASELVGAVEVVRLAIHEGDEAARNTGSRSGEAVVQAELQSPDVEVVKVIIKRRISVLGLEGLVVLLVAEALAEEVANMAAED